MTLTIARVTESLFFRLSLMYRRTSCVTLPSAMSLQQPFGDLSGEPHFVGVHCDYDQIAVSTLVRLGGLYKDAQKGEAPFVMIDPDVPLKQVQDFVSA